MVVCKLIPLILSLKMNRSWVGNSIGCVPSTRSPLTFVPEGWVFQLTRLIKLNADGLMSRKLI